jgi:hypothetical protein
MEKWALETPPLHSRSSPSTSFPTLELCQCVHLFFPKLTFHSINFTNAQGRGGGEWMEGLGLGLGELGMHPPPHPRFPLPLFPSRLIACFPSCCHAPLPFFAVARVAYGGFGGGFGVRAPRKAVKRGRAVGATGGDGSDMDDVVEADVTAVTLAVRGAAEGKQRKVWNCATCHCTSPKHSPPPPVPIPSPSLQLLSYPHHVTRGYQKDPALLCCACFCLLSTRAFARVTDTMRWVPVLCLCC